MENEKLYEIRRFYRAGNKAWKTVKMGLSLEEAQKHCNDPSTKGDGWFDGYHQMSKFDALKYRTFNFLRKLEEEYNIDGYGLAEVIDDYDNWQYFEGKEAVNSE